MILKYTYSGKVGLETCEISLEFLFKMQIPWHHIGKPNTACGSDSDVYPLKEASVAAFCADRDILGYYGRKLQEKQGKQHIMLKYNSMLYFNSSNFL